MILEITRGHVRAEIDGRTVTIEGEGYLRGYGSPDFVLYKDSIQRWDAPNECATIDDATREGILAAVKSEMETEKGMTVEIE